MTIHSSVPRSHEPSYLVTKGESREERMEISLWKEGRGSVRCEGRGGRRAHLDVLNLILGVFEIDDCWRERVSRRSDAIAECEADSPLIATAR
jgi:hypothetical protein